MNGRSYFWQDTLKVNIGPSNSNTHFVKLKFPYHAYLGLIFAFGGTTRIGLQACVTV